MSFLMPCPNCGERDVHEFRHGGEISSLSQRKSMDDSDGDLTRYFYFTKNPAGESVEWWYHSSVVGCRKWFVAPRKYCNQRHTFVPKWPEKRPKQQ